jgi:hypothetical protein
MRSNQHEIHFSVEDANELLPWVIERVVRIILLFENLDNRGFDIMTGLWRPKGNGHADSGPPAEYDQFKKLIAELDMKGVFINNFVKGIVDFPHIRPDGEEVYLCWMKGEDSVRFWHRIPDGFMGRVPLEESD